MKVTVERVYSVEQYLRYWTKSMADVHWFKNPRLFDYNRDEETEEIVREFGKPGSIYLVAKSQDTREILGVLGVKVKGNVGIFERWQPAVPLKYRNMGVGEALINEAFSWLRQNRAPKVKSMLRYPYEKPETVEWLMTLYQKFGFKQKGYVGVMLLVNLQRVKMTLQKIKNLHLVNGNEFSLEKFVEFTRRAYMTTPEDIAIHGLDPNISNPDANIRVLQAIKNGKYGSSPPECWKVATLENEVAGFVIAFMPKSKYRPLHGVIAELGGFSRISEKGHRLFVNG